MVRSGRELTESWGTQVYLERLGSEGEDNVRSREGLTKSKGNGEWHLGMDRFEKNAGKEGGIVLWSELDAEVSETRGPC